MRQLLAAVALAVLLGTLATVGAGPADAAAGSPGECRDDRGVTVVVDFTELGGDVVVRCTDKAVSTGLGALHAAGFTTIGTARFGDSVVCRLQGRPARDEELDTRSDPEYREQCEDMPPDDAFWSYWSAEDEGTWRYNSEGATSHDPREGGFEGWAFALNSGQGSLPPPRVAPDRPDQPAQSAPTSRPPGSEPTGKPSGPPGSSSSDGPSSAPTTRVTPAGPGSPGGSDKADRPGKKATDEKRPPTTDPTRATPSPTTASEGVVVTGELPSDPTAADQGGPPPLLWAAVGLVILLGSGVGLTAWRRNRAP